MENKTKSEKEKIREVNLTINAKIKFYSSGDIKIDDKTFKTIKRHILNTLREGACHIDYEAPYLEDGILEIVGCCTKPATYKISESRLK